MAEIVHLFRLVVYPIIHRVSYIFIGFIGSLSHCIPINLLSLKDPFVCPKNPGLPLQSYSRDGIKTINP